MSLESRYGYRVIRDAVRKLFIDRGYRPRRVRRGFRIPHAKYLFSYYDEEGVLVGVFYDRNCDAIVEHSIIRKGHLFIPRLMEWSHDMLVTLLQTEPTVNERHKQV